MRTYFHFSHKSMKNNSIKNLDAISPGLSPLHVSLSLCLFVIKSFQILISSHSLLFVSPSFRPLVTKSLRLLISHSPIFSPSHFPFSPLYLASSLTSHLSPSLRLFVPMSPRLPKFSLYHLPSVLS